MSAPKKKRVLFICAACGEHFATYAATERHDPDHRRIVSVIDTEPATVAPMSRPVPS